MTRFSRRGLAAVVLMTAAIAVCIGCRNRTDPQVFISAQTALENGLKAYENKDYQSAVTNFDAALNGGGLLPDLYSDALLKRAECNARLDNFDVSHADLDTAAQGADMVEVHRVRSFVYQRQGRTRESKAELDQARRIDARIKPIGE